MSQTYLRAAKDIFLFSGIGFLYSVQMHHSRVQAQTLIGIIAISRLSNRLLLEYVRHRSANLADMRGTREEALAKGYACINALVSLMTIIALRYFQFLGSRGTTSFACLAILNICNIKLNGRYREGYEDLHR